MGSYCGTGKCSKPFAEGVVSQPRHGYPLWLDEASCLSEHRSKLEGYCWWPLAQKPRKTVALNAGKDQHLG